MPDTDPTLLPPEKIDRIDARATDLVGIVHGEGNRRDVARLVRDLDRTELIGLAISCAAMVNPDQRLDDLLAWLRPITSRPANLDDESGWTADQLRQAHAAFNAGDRRARVVAGNQIYNRNQMRAARARTAAEGARA